jgi:peroxiredoxin
LQHKLRELERAEIDVLVVTFERPEAAERYAADMGLPWPVLIDERKSLYGAYGMDRAGTWDIWGPRTWWAYARQIVRGRWPEPAQGDVYQRGGDILIDPNGIVRLHHVGNGPALA